MAVLAAVSLAARCTPSGGPTRSASNAEPGTTTTRSGAAGTPPAACREGRGTLSDARRLDPKAPARMIVYLPPCYATSGARRYPTLIVLHGGGADQTQWPDIGLATTADDLIAPGRVPPFIAVAPDIGDGPPQDAEAFVVNELLPWMDGRLRTQTTPKDRGIGGISLGGAAALRIAAAHPDLFDGVGGHSPAVKPFDRDLAANLSSGGSRVWLDVGENDSLRPAVENMAGIWGAKGVAVELHVSPGRHDRSYWRAQMGSYLLFYAKGWG